MFWFYVIRYYVLMINGEVRLRHATLLDIQYAQALAGTLNE